jgi:surface carbohydrate biosynthesis protein
MIIVIPIEVKVRELFHKVFLSYQILKNINNSKVIICSNRHMFQRISRFENCIFFEKNVFTKRLNLKLKINNKILMIDEEGPIYLLEKFYLDYRYKKETFKYYDKLLFWGYNDLGKLSISKKNKKNIFVSGHPKFDLLKLPYVKIYDKKVKKIKKKYNKYILFASSFEDDRKLALRQQIIAIKNSCEGKSNSYIKNQISNLKKLIFIHQKNYELTVTLLKNLAYQNPDINIIFRRHPAEEDNEVERKFGKIPKNLLIVYSGSITPWIIGSEIYMHSGCNTFFEASILKKKIITFLPYSFGKKHNFFKNSKSYFSDLKKTENYINDLLKNKRQKISNSDSDDLEKIITNASIKNSYETIIRLIKNSGRNLNSKYYYAENEISNISTYFFKIKHKLLSFLSFIKNNFVIKTFLINFLPEKYILSSNQKKKKIDHLSYKDIKTIFDELKKVDRSKIKININTICENVFICKKK